MSKLLNKIKIPPTMTVPPALPGLRERNKAKRCEAILDATLDLLGSQPVGTVTTEQIAARAEVSPASVYNLIGTRDEVIRAIIVRFTKGVTVAMTEASAVRGATQDPMYRSRLLIECSAPLLVARSQAYRHVMTYLGGLGPSAVDVERHGGGNLDSTALHVVSIREAQKVGMIRKGVDAKVLAAHIADHFNGVLLRWSFGGIGNEHLHATAMHGLLVALLSSCSEGHRRSLQVELAALQRELLS